MNNYPNSIKNGAELLLKGASLLKEPCEICGGVQLKYKNIIICVNCKKENEKSSSEIKPILETRFENDSILENKNFQYCIEIIKSKIINSIENVKIEDDYYIQKNKLDLIESYIRVLKALTTL